MKPKSKPKSKSMRWDDFRRRHRGQGLSKQELGKLYQDDLRKDSETNHFDSPNNKRKKRICVFISHPYFEWYWGIVDPKVDAEGFQSIAYEDGTKGSVDLSRALWKEEKRLPEEEDVDEGPLSVPDQDAARAMLNFAGNNGGIITVANQDKNCEEEKVASVIVEIMRRKKMSYPRLTQLVRHMIQGKTEADMVKLFTCLCDDRHTIPTETLNEFWNMCTSAS